ncbi:RNA polymerase sigma-70 factor, ECF subfamily [Actinacidiphila yanglinensis]|uniref:RNA polymerase sigma-70 factor, ECF subfamily n=1 Tax=Actinacidiphila yanglinensis TaxID=310779 RepID=A0A1H6C433_9ACTN|nr:RNA polymerase sigma factor [Actinacidiphila yanglinensis]SEG67721.1 RNA polymerase sigma-70 factor, ECF subfamily [Actinacidiphila yanglinensis]
MTAAPETGVRHAPGPDEPSESDASIIERSLDEPEAFAELFDRYAEDIHRYAARRVGAEVADDLMAEAFVVAFQRRRRYDVSRPQARPWLYGIATNLVHDHRRAEARRLRALSRAAATAPDGWSGGDEPMAEQVAARVSAESVRGALAGALAKLPARYRDVLLVVAWGDLNYAEAAEALGIPVGTVRSRLNRARGRLRDALGGSDPTILQEEGA